MKIKAQTTLEYMLIFMIVAVALFGAMAKVDFKAIKNYVFMRPADEAGNTITIEAMTGGN